MITQHLNIKANVDIVNVLYYTALKKNTAKQMVEKQCKGGSGPAKASQGSCLSRLTLSGWIETCGCHD